MMNKKEWLLDAINFIDSLDSKEFEEFVISCAPYYQVIEIKYDELKFGKSIDLAKSKAANQDFYCTDDISLAA